MKLISGIILLTVLAGCGADGPPVRPQLSTSVSVGSGGVTTSTQATVKSGPVSIGVSL